LKSEVDVLRVVFLHHARKYEDISSNDFKKSVNDLICLPLPYTAEVDTEEPVGSTPLTIGEGGVSAAGLPCTAASGPPGAEVEAAEIPCASVTAGAAAFILESISVRTLVAGRAVASCLKHH
jgi:hypothetical protein